MARSRNGSRTSHGDGRELPGAVGPEIGEPSVAHLEQPDQSAGDLAGRVRSPDAADHADTRVLREDRLDLEAELRTCCRVFATAAVSPVSQVFHIAKYRRARTLAE